jgi:hypothetical protein
MVVTLTCDDGSLRDDDGWQTFAIRRRLSSANCVLSRSVTAFDTHRGRFLACAVLPQAMSDVRRHNCHCATTAAPNVAATCGQRNERVVRRSVKWFQLAPSDGHIVRQSADSGNSDADERLPSPSRSAV